MPLYTAAVPAAAVMCAATAAALSADAAPALVTEMFSAAAVVLQDSFALVDAVKEYLLQLHSKCLLQQLPRM